MRKKFQWNWLAWLALLLWLGAYSQRMGVEPMISEAIWISPNVKEVFFTILYYFSTICAVLIAIGFIVYVIIWGVQFVKTKKRTTSPSIDINEVRELLSANNKQLEDSNRYLTHLMNNKQSNKNKTRGKD